jgi:hypothetical protein
LAPGPVVLELAGHGVAAEAPAAQKDPIGHTTGELDSAAQKAPSGHSSASPNWQNFPATQLAHCHGARVVATVTLYVPFRQVQS